MDINLEGITYAVELADLTTYHVSSTSHLDMTGARSMTNLNILSMLKEYMGMS
jgi:hypothetical protein